MPIEQGLEGGQRYSRCLYASYNVKGRKGSKYRQFIVLLRIKYFFKLSFRTVDNNFMFLTYNSLGKIGISSLINYFS